MTHTSFKRAEGFRVVLKRRNASDRLVIFFADRGSCGPVPRGDYGADFAAGHGLNAAAVQPVEPRWYQGPLGDVLTRALSEIVAGFGHVTFAGAGMGGYGAMLAAQALAPDHVIAVRPLSSLDPGRVPVGLARRADFAALGRDLEPVVTHRAGHYTIFAGRAADRAHLRRFWLPRDRLTLHGIDALDRSGPLRLPGARLLDLLGQHRAEKDLADIA